MILYVVIGKKNKFDATYQYNTGVFSTAELARAAIDSLMKKADRAMRAQKKLQRWEDDRTNPVTYEELLCYERDK